MLWFSFILEFYLPSFLGMVMYDNESGLAEDKISTRNRIETHHINEYLRHVCDKQTTRRSFSPPFP